MGWEGSRADMKKSRTTEITFYLAPSCSPEFAFPEGPCRNIV